MKTFTKFSLILALVMASLAARAQSTTNTVTGVLTFTNGTVTGDGIRVNGQLRIFTNASSGLTFLTNGTGSGSATNVFSNWGNYSLPIPTPNLSFTNTNTLVLFGRGLTISLTGNFASLVLTTNLTGTNTWKPELPFDALAPSTRTNNASELVYGTKYSSRSIETGIVAMAKFMDTSSAQSATNKRIFLSALETGTIGTVGASNITLMAQDFASGGESNLLATRLTFADESGGFVTLIGPYSYGFPYPVMVDQFTNYVDALSDMTIQMPLFPEDSPVLLNVGSAWRWWGKLTSLDYYGFEVTNNWKTFNIFESKADFWTGFYATNTSQKFPTNYNGRYVDSTLSGATTFSGPTNQWTGDLATPFVTVSGLANTNNVIDPGDSINLDLTGPTANFNVTGILKGRPGREINLRNKSGFSIRISYQSGTTGDTNRFETGTGADVISTNQPAHIRLIYMGSRWEVRNASN